MKLKKIIPAVLVCILLAGGIYFDTHCVTIDSRTYKKDVKEIEFVDLDENDCIRQINKCTALEYLFITDTSENRISRLKNLNNLNTLMIVGSEISSADCEKISQFDNLENLYIYLRSTVDFKGFDNDNVSRILLFYDSSAVNIESLSECQSLKILDISYSTVDNCIVIEDGGCTMKDSSVFSSFDSVEKLTIWVNKIEDISGILEMDSLNEFSVVKDSVSEDDIKLLEDKGVSVTYYGEN